MLQRLTLGLGSLLPTDGCADRACGVHTVRRQAAPLLDCQLRDVTLHYLYTHPRSSEELLPALNTGETVGAPMGCRCYVCRGVTRREGSIAYRRT